MLNMIKEIKEPEIKEPELLSSQCNNINKYTQTKPMMVISVNVESDSLVFFITLEPFFF